MKLYGLIGACSFVPHVALEWVKAHSHENYEFEAVSREFIKSPEFLALNPRGAVPLFSRWRFSVIPKPSNFALFR